MSDEQSTEKQNPAESHEFFGMTPEQWRTKDKAERLRMFEAAFGDVKKITSYFVEKVVDLCGMTGHQETILLFRGLADRVELNANYTQMSIIADMLGDIRQKHVVAHEVIQEMIHPEEKKGQA